MTVVQSYTMSRELQNAEDRVTWHGDEDTILNMTAEQGGLSSDPFGSTHWSVVLEAGNTGSESALAAMERLCTTYWYPVYAYVRRRSTTAEDAQDCTQAFFTHLLEKKTISQADPERGRFRAFLLTAVKNFLVNEHKRANAQKRGGGCQKLSLDFEAAESRYWLEPEDARTPERLFEQEWALTLLNRVLKSLGAEYSADGNADLYDELKGFLTGNPQESSHAHVASRLGITEVASRTALSRLRKRYRDRLTEEIAQTVASPDEVPQELHSLFLALSM